MNRKIFVIAVISLFLDQMSKILVGIFLTIHETFPIIKNFFSLQFIENYGAAWSLFNNKVDFLILVSLVALFIIYHYMCIFKQNKRNNLAFGLVLGGIMGNLIDRVFLGYVRDFLSFKIIHYHYPIFNFADMFIVIGIFLLIVSILKGDDKHENRS